VSDAPPSITGYRILSRLGKGGMATVYRAQQIAQGREVALKVVAPHLAGDANFSQRFLREARAGVLVRHPQVIACFDVGLSDGHLFLAMELVTGGDLLALLTRHQGRLDEATAVALVHDVAAGLEAIEAAGLVHRDIKPANIFITGAGSAKLADLGLVRFAGDDRMTVPGTVMGTPAYIAPEQARGADDVDIRADIYSLGATLFHLLTGEPPFISDNPLTTLVRAINEPFPDARRVRPELSPGVLGVLTRATQKDRTQRYASARLMREDLERLAGHPPAPGARIRTPLPASLPASAPAERSAARTPPPAASRVRTPQPEATPTDPRRLRTPLPEVVSAVKERAAGRPGAEAQGAPNAEGEPRRAPGVEARPAAPAAGLDREQLMALARRIVLDKDRLKASLVLAPGASFSRFLLEQLLQATGVGYGVNSAAVHEATRASTIARRIILATGIPPCPGVPGRDVRGEIIAALTDALIIRISDDAMEAVALTFPGTMVSPVEIEQAVKSSGVRYGIDVLALRRLRDGPPSADGRLVFARGRPFNPGRSAGFTLCGEIANVTIDRLDEALQLARVRPGTLLGVWCAAERGRSGMDVLGRARAATPPGERQAADCIGDGAELCHDAHGRVAVRATRAGLCQRQADGAVRVVGAYEIAGDLGPDHPPIDTDDLVVVHGSVLAGASIRSRGDVVVLGDLDDAVVVSGGNLEVGGAITAGDQELTIAGDVIAARSFVRRIMAGSVRITGEARNCELLASGDISVGQVIGGALTAGGCIQVAVAGDRDGTTTELWAGHRLDYAHQVKSAKLAEQRHELERDRLFVDRQAIASEITQVEAKQRRLGLSRFVARDVLDTMRGRLLSLEQSRLSVSAAAECVRLNLAKSREITSQLSGLGDDASARVMVSVVAHAGVVARLADVEPEVLSAPRLKYRLGATLPAVATPPADGAPTAAG
jgi:serine/threonine protein kinase